MSAHSSTPATSGRKDYSPFTPGVPVPLEFFVGRSKEIERLRDKVAQASTGHLQVAFLSGERGIGKTSIASFLRALAERDQHALTLHAFLGGVASVEEVVRIVFDRLVKESIDKPWYTKVTNFLGNHVRKVGLFGVSAEFSPEQHDLGRLVKDFAPVLRNLLKSLSPEKKAIFLIFDDINGLAESEVFANWFKSLVDEIATSDPFALCLLVSGLEERRQALIAGQPSLSRVFEIVELRAWSDEETNSFFKQAFDSVRISVEESALSFLTTFTGGLPVLAHEIGDAVFNVDKDGKIDQSDATAGVIAAADIVGKKYLEPQVFRVLRSQKYRAILRKLADSKSGFNMEFVRKDLLQRASTDEKRVLDNFLRRMKALGVIHPAPDGGPGSYEFNNLLHYFYFAIEARRASGEPS